MCDVAGVRLPLVCGASSAVVTIRVAEAHDRRLTADVVVLGCESGLERELVRSAARRSMVGGRHGRDAALTVTATTIATNDDGGAGDGRASPG